MLSGLSEEEIDQAWNEIEESLRKFVDEDGFTGQCEMVIAVGTK